MKIRTAAVGALCSSLLLAGCGGGSNATQAHQTDRQPAVTRGPVTFDHIQANLSGYVMTKRTTNRLNFARGSGSGAVQVAVTGVETYTDITPEQYVKINAGAENIGPQPALRSIKVISSHPIKIKGGSDGYAMVLNGTESNGHVVRQDIVATRSASTHEVATVVATGEMSQIGLISPLMGSLAFIKPETRFAPKVTGQAQDRAHLLSYIKHAPKMAK